MIFILKNLPTEKILLTINSIYKISKNIPIYKDLYEGLMPIFTSELILANKESSDIGEILVGGIYNKGDDAPYYDKNNQKYTVYEQKCIGDQIIEKPEDPKTLELFYSVKNKFTLEFLFTLMIVNSEIKKQGFVSRGRPLIINAHSESAEELKEIIKFLLPSNHLESKKSEIIIIENEERSRDGIIGIKKIENEEDFISMVVESSKEVQKFLSEKHLNKKANNTFIDDNLLGILCGLTEIPHKKEVECEPIPGWI